MSVAGWSRPDHVVPQGDPIELSLVDAFWDYEHVLMDNDLDGLDRLFAPGRLTMRGDAAGLLVGKDQIDAFRGRRGGAPARRVLAVHARTLGPDDALLVAETLLLAGGRGQQTQVWHRGAAGWQVAAAHVSVPAPALDTRVWRVVGDPLVPGNGPGPLSGESVAVKDLYAVAGHRVGAGNPAWLAAAETETRTAPVVQALLDAGADVRGLARTDEFAYSLAGTNSHHGTPPNPGAPRRISGGSSSGSASAVALGHATIGLGTDTGGSIRVPSAYQGLWGLRPTHGVLSVHGLLPLAPDFDTVGWMTRHAGLLEAVGDVLLPPDTHPGTLPEPVMATGLVGLADTDVAAAVGDWAGQRGLGEVGWDATELAGWLPAFQEHQAVQAWASHGAWLVDRLDTLGADVRSRFERARDLTADGRAEPAAAEAARLRTEVRERLGDRVLVLPSASSTAPPAGDAAALDAVRQATMMLTCLAGLGGLPAVSVPVTTADGLPAGVCLVGPAGSDRALLALARGLA